MEGIVRARSTDVSHRVRRQIETCFEKPESTIKDNLNSFWDKGNL